MVQRCVEIGESKRRMRLIDKRWEKKVREIVTGTDRVTRD